MADSPLRFLPHLPREMKSAILRTQRGDREDLATMGKGHRGDPGVMTGTEVWGPLGAATTHEVKRKNQQDKERGLRGTQPRSSQADALLMNMGLFSRLWKCSLGVTCPEAEQIWNPTKGVFFLGLSW